MKATETARNIVSHSSRAAVLDATRANSIREEIKMLAQEVSNKFLRLSQLLRTVQKDRLYLQWGFDSFEGWAEADSGIHPETARVFVSMEKALVEEAHIDRGVLADIGWTKAKAIVPLQRSGKLAPRQVEILKAAQTLPTPQFQTYVAQVKASGGEMAAPGTLPNRTPVSFFLDAEQQETITQARRIAEQVTGSIDPGVQLVAICQDFISSITPDEAKAPDNWRARRVAMLLDVLENHFGLHVELKGAKNLDAQRIYERIKEHRIPSAPLL